MICEVTKMTALMEDSSISVNVEALALFVLEAEYTDKVVRELERLKH